MRILEVGGVTTDFRSVWLLVFWGILTRGGHDLDHDDRSPYDAFAALSEQFADP